MIHPIPPGTRDVLPDEMRELRRLQDSLLGVFEDHAYGEVRTPTIEYADVVSRGDEASAGDAYRFSVYHVMEVDELAPLFPVTVHDIG